MEIQQLTVQGRSTETWKACGERIASLRGVSVSMPHVALHALSPGASFGVVWLKVFSRRGLRQDMSKRLHSGGACNRNLWAPLNPKP